MVIHIFDWDLAVSSNLYPTGDTAVQFVLVSTWLKWN